MYPRDHRGYVEEQHYSEIYEERVFEDNYYNGGSAMHVMKPNYQPLPKHGHNQNHGHVYGGGGFNEHGRNGHENRVEQHYEAWHEGNWRHDGWGKNDHSAHGGKNHYNGEYPHKEEVIKYGGYGAHQGHFGPQKGYGQHHDDKMRAPVWLSRGNIED